MSDRTQDLKNLRAVATACKNYVDETKEQILWQVGQYNITTQDDNTSASTKTVPANATRCKIKRIYGLTQKLNPTTASDSTSYSVKTMPATVYDFDISKVDGNSEKSENLINNPNTQTETSQYAVTFTPQGDGTYKLSGTATGRAQYIIQEIELSAGNYVLKDFGYTQNDSVGIFGQMGGTYYDLVGTTNGQRAFTTNTSGTLKIMIDVRSNINVDNVVIKPMLVSGSTAPTEFKAGYTGIHNFAWTGVKVYDSDNVEQVSTTIDLSSILYNGSPLFEGNSLKAANDVKDILTPYKATKKLGYVDLGTLTYTRHATNTSLFFASGISDIKQVANNQVDNLLSANYKTMAYYISGTNDGFSTNKSVSFNNNNKTVAINDTSFIDMTGEQVAAALMGVYLVYELATPIEVSINLASLLRGITGYSNGTISLLNTNNQDTANLITYNSIIKENCCAKMVQSRGGNVIKTVSFSTQASDGWSAGSVYNYRDFTTNKRGTNVRKVGLDTFDYTAQYGGFYGDASTDYQYNYTLNTTKFICLGYTEYKYNNSLSDFFTQDNVITFSNTRRFWINDSRYSGITAATFKSANAGNLLYYELADASKTSTDITPIENVLEVQPNDTLAFYDANDNLVTVQSDLTYRIEVES